MTQLPGKWYPRIMLIRLRDGSPNLELVIREEVRRAIPGAQVYVHEMMKVLDLQFRPWRLGAQLFGALSLLALVVASIGVYSVVAFAVRLRTHEMGVRAALGARPVDLLRLVVGEGAVVVAIGVVLGLAAALAAGQLVASLLYGVTPRDPAVLGLSAGALLLIGVLASLVPAWRASRVDPARVLRDE